MDAWLGIDVAKEKLDVALLTNKGKHQAVFANTGQGFGSLLNWLEKRTAKSRAVAVCLEATGHFGEAVAAFLHERGYPVSVVNPARIKAYAESVGSRQKTDHTDAELIARYAQTQTPALWTPPEPAQRELQALVRQLDNLKTMRQQERNRLTAGLSSPTVFQSLQKHIAFLEAQIADLQQRIREHIDQHPTLKQQRDLLDSIPGLGDSTIPRLLAEIRDIRAFDSAAQLAAYAGLTPYQRRSGSSLHGRSHISKRGNADLRAALYMPAIVAKHHNPLLRTFAQRLHAHGKSPMTIVVAVMRKLLHLVYGVLKSGQPFDPCFVAAHP